uniref:Uncharacterized protein n=1 Tax=Anabas testudineus TaxID=64144 RepID=A0A3Q1IDR8_ANATE
AHLIEVLKIIVTFVFFSCEEGWELHGGKCYYFSTRDSSWYQSRDDCRRGGGDLVKIDTQKSLTQSISSTLHQVINFTDEVFSVQHFLCWFDVSCKIPYKSICEKSAETRRV